MMNAYKSFFVGVALLGFGAAAQADDGKAYTLGTVTAVSFIKTKPGKFNEYMKYLDTTYKAIMEGLKKEGLIVGYHIYDSVPKTPHDPDLILTVTYTNMAALDKVDERDAVTGKIAGSLEARDKSSAEREALRESLGGDLIRELILK